MTEKQQKQTIKDKIQDNEDFVNFPRLSNSLKAVLNKYPDGIPDERIATMLMMTLEEVKTMYEDIISKIKTKIGG